MAWENWERLLRLERLSVEIGQRQKENRDALIALRDQTREDWIEGSPEDQPAPPSGTGPANVNASVTGCNGQGVDGATVTIVVGGFTFTGTTNSTGDVSFTSLPTGAATITASESHWSGTVSQSVTLGPGLQSFGLSLATATPQTGRKCSCGCAIPIPTALTYTSAGGGGKVPAGTVFTLNYRTAFGDWAGSVGVTVMGLTVNECNLGPFVDHPVGVDAAVTLTCDAFSHFVANEYVRRQTCADFLSHAVVGPAADLTQFLPLGATVFSAAITLTGTCDPVNQTGTGGQTLVE